MSKRKVIALVFVTVMVGLSVSILVTHLASGNGVVGSQDSAGLPAMSFAMRNTLDGGNHPTNQSTNQSGVANVNNNLVAQSTDPPADPSLGDSALPPQKVPSLVMNYVPVAIYNSQGTATTNPFNERVTVDSERYASLEGANLQNVMWFASNGSVIPSWIESGDSNSNTGTVYWLKISASLGAYSFMDIYMGFGSLSEDFLSNTSNEGVAPQLTPTYGQYDNGANVFWYYQNFKSSSSATGWTLTGATVSNGLTVLASTSGSNIQFAFSGTLPGRLTYYASETGSPGSYFYGGIGEQASGTSAYWGIAGSGVGGSGNVQPGTGNPRGFYSPSESKGVYAQFGTYNSGSTEYWYYNHVQEQTASLSIAPNAVQFWTGGAVNLYVYYLTAQYGLPANVMPSVSFGSIHSQFSSTGYAGQDVIYLSQGLFDNSTKNPITYYGFNETSPGKVTNTIVPGYVGVNVTNAVGIGTGTSVPISTGNRIPFSYFWNTDGYLDISVPIGVTGGAQALNETGPMTADPNATVRELNVSASISPISGNYVWGNPDLYPQIGYDDNGGLNLTNLNNTKASSYSGLINALDAAEYASGMLGLITTPFPPLDIIFDGAAVATGSIAGLSRLLASGGTIDHNYNETQYDPLFAKLGVDNGTFNVYQSPSTGNWYINSTNLYSFQTFIEIKIASVNFNTPGQLNISATNLLSYSRYTTTYFTGAQSNLTIPMRPAGLIYGKVMDGSTALAHQELVIQDGGKTYYEESSTDGSYRFFAREGSTVYVNTTSPNGTTYHYHQYLPGGDTWSKTLYVYANTTPVINFTESGLPTGTTWSVSVGSNTYHNSSNVISIPESFEGNNTFGYTVNGVSGFSPSPSSGKVDISNQLSNNVRIDFIPVGSVTFTESGLPSGDIWKVTLNGTTKQAYAGGSISFTEPYGTYLYTVSSQNGYVPSPSTGIVTIGSSPQTVGITYTLKPYTVTFNEGGLPIGTTWSVTLGGNSKSSTSSSISFSEPDGSYSFSVPDVYYSSTETYYPSPSSGTVTVNGGNVAESIQFTGSATSCVYSLAPVLLSNYTYEYAENITVGESIMTYNFTTGTMQQGTVLQVFVTQHTEMYVINGYLKVARDQDMWTNHGYVQAQYLTINDTIFDVYTGHYEKIQSISVDYGSFTMYDFYVSTNRNYIVWSNLMEDRLP